MKLDLQRRLFVMHDIRFTISHSRWKDYATKREFVKIKVGSKIRFNFCWDGNIQDSGNIACRNLDTFGRFCRYHNAKFIIETEIQNPLFLFRFQVLKFSVADGYTPVFDQVSSSFHDLILTAVVHSIQYFEFSAGEREQIDSIVSKLTLERKIKNKI